MAKSSLLIDLNRYEIIETLEAPTQQTVEHIAFDPGGKYLAATSLNNWVTVWDVDTGEVFFEISGHDDLVADAAFTSDGDYLITGSVDQTVKIWDVSEVSSGDTLTAPRLTLPHPAPVDGVAINSNDTLLATIGGDGEVRFFPFLLEIDQMLELAQSRVTAQP